jgi:hypothetical protein
MIRKVAHFRVLIRMPVKRHALPARSHQGVERRDTSAGTECGMRLLSGEG